jgi:hypothetical protein
VNVAQWKQGSKYIKQIDMDIERTDRAHIFFRQRYGPKYCSSHFAFVEANTSFALCRQRSLFAVLKAYSVHNPLVGYTQGMAQITATILMYMDDEEVRQCARLLRSIATMAKGLTTVQILLKLIIIINRRYFGYWIA